MMSYLARSLAALFVVFLPSTFAAVLHVDLNSANPVPPYTNWITAATNLQDAVDAASSGDEILATNGVYRTGGRVFSGLLTNRVVLDKPVLLRSVNGPLVTAIQGNSVLGSNAVRCVCMTSNSILSGFTLTNGGTLSSGDHEADTSGGGIWTTNKSGAIVSNCVLVGNAAAVFGGAAFYGYLDNCRILRNSAYNGGGVAYSLVTNSLIASNSASGRGGGTFFGTQKNCTISQNTAVYGGGADSCSLYGCLVLSNAAPQGGGGIGTGFEIQNCTICGNRSTNGAGGIDAGGSLQNSIIYYNNGIVGAVDCAPGVFGNGCCTASLLQGIGNLTNDPGFVDYTAGNFHLRPDSACLNSGTGSRYMSAWITTDFDGGQRVVGGFIDIGVSEFQTPGVLVPYVWAQQYGLSADGSIDSDGDGLNNWQEAFAGTNPTNAASALRLFVSSHDASGITLTWPSVNGNWYYLQRSTNSFGTLKFSTIRTYLLVATNLISFKDSTATNAGPYFYRVEVR